MNANTTYSPLIGTFDTYFTDADNNPKTELLNLLNQSGNWNYDIVIIESAIGNGATHLLHGVFDEIEKQNREATYIGGEAMFNSRKMYSTLLGEMKYKDETQINTEFFLLDGYHYIEASPNLFEQFIALAKPLIQRGIKIVVTSNIGYHPQLANEFPNHAVITTTFPISKKVWAKIIRKRIDEWEEGKSSVHLSMELKEKIIQGLLAKEYQSVRIMQNTVIGLFATIAYKKTNLRNENVDSVLEKIIDYCHTASHK